jgi:hypothetical protein
MEIRKLDDVFDVIVESKERVIELHNNILDDTLTDPQLTQLTSTSRTAIWRLWAFIIPPYVFGYTSTYGACIKKRYKP